MLTVCLGFCFLFLLVCALLQGHGLFTKKKLKPEFNDPAAQRRSFTIVTPKRTFDLIVDSKIEFGYWKTALEHIDGERK